LDSCRFSLLLLQRICSSGLWFHYEFGHLRCHGLLYCREKFNCK
jgi:hypothetical protein